jgi:hypothetical protein
VGAKGKAMNNWEHELEKFLAELHNLPFTKRKRFFDYLQSLTWERTNKKIAWPDVLLFLEAGDMSRGLKEVQ